MAILVFLLLWGLSGLAGYGFTMGYFTKRYPAFDHTFTAMLIAIFGPLGLLAAIIKGDGSFRLKGLTKEERWAEHQRLWPTLSRAWFEKDE